MKFFLTLLAFALPLIANAGTIHCKSKNGTQVVAKQSWDWDRLFDIQVASPGGEFKTYPTAYAAQFVKHKGKVAKLVITQPGKGVIASLKDSNLENCVFTKSEKDDAEMALINLTPPNSL